MRTMSQLRKISVKADGHVRLLFIFFIVNSDPSGSGSVLASPPSNSLTIVFFSSPNTFSTRRCSRERSGRLISVWLEMHPFPHGSRRFSGLPVSSLSVLSVPCSTRMTICPTRFLSCSKLLRPAKKKKKKRWEEWPGSRRASLVAAVHFSPDLLSRRSRLPCWW